MIRRSSLTVLALSLVVLPAASAAPGKRGDTVAPVISWKAPAGGSTVSGGVTLSGSAADDRSVSSVAVAVDGGAYKTATGTGNWSTVLDTTSLANGAHTLSARATDSSGNTAAKISVSVSNNPTSVAAFDTTATITDPNWFKQMYAAGYRLYVMHSTAWGTCTPWSNTQAQLKMALDAGLKIAVYTRDPRCWQGGIAAAGPYAGQLQFFALDVETDPGIPVTPTMVDGVRSLGVRPVIYTGSGMWPTIMSGSSAFSGVALWDTDVRPGFSLSTWTPNVLAPAPTVYGGWNTAANPRVLVQQAFEVVVNGIPVDVNSVASSFLIDR